MIYEGDISVTILVLDQWGEPAAGLDKDSLPQIKISQSIGQDIVDDLVDLLDLDDNHTPWGVYEKGGGYYRFDLPSLSNGSYTIYGQSCSFRIVPQTIVIENFVKSSDLPTNFGDLAINASGHIERVVLVDTTTTNTDMRGTDGAVTSLQSVLDAIDNIETDLTPIIEMLNSIISKLSSTVVKVISPLGEDGISITIIQGDDYLSTDERNILFISNEEDQWGDLTGANIVFGVSGTNILKSCDIISPTGIQSISLELTKEETSIPQGTYDYDVQATLSNDSVITLWRGKLFSIKSFTN